MVDRVTAIRFSEHAYLYDMLIPSGHFLRRFNDEVDFSVVREMLSSKYCADNGRLAEDPVRMFKYIILKMLTDLSDVDLVEEVRYNLSHKFFLGMMPEDLPVAPSTLCKFRKMRLEDNELLSRLIDQTIGMAIERGILKKNIHTGKVHVNVIIDGTHIASHLNLYRPLPNLKIYSKKLRAAVYKADESLSGSLEKDDSINDLSEEIAYGYRLVKHISENLAHLLDLQHVKRSFNRFKELVDDIDDHYSANAIDPDVRQGHKTHDTDFFGYKDQLAIDEESRLILGAKVTSGEVNDSMPGKELLADICHDDRLKVEEVLGDTAYSGQPILELAKQEKFTLIAPPHPGLGSGIDGRDGFTFNKDADMFCCPKGHLAISKRTVKYKNDNNRKAIIYKFDLDKCRVCPLRNACLKCDDEKIAKRKEGRTFSVSMLTDEQKELLERSQTDRFKERKKQRYKIEQTNAHAKQGYSLGVTKGIGIKAMEVQTMVTIFVHNIKLILGKSAK